MRHSQVIILSLISISAMAAEIDTTTLLTVENFIKGLAKGLSYDAAVPDSCYTEFDTLMYNVDQIRSDITGIQNGSDVAQILLVSNLMGLFESAKSMATSCQFGELGFKLKSLTSEGWYYLLVGRFTTNYSTVLGDVSTLLGGCTSSDCGEAAGQLFRVMIGWGL